MYHRRVDTLPQFNLPSLAHLAGCNRNNSITKSCQSDCSRLIAFLRGFRSAEKILPQNGYVRKCLDEIVIKYETFAAHRPLAPNGNAE